ncbi:GUN4 domain-containing protein [Cephalotus follicularis]|uniref:GUN4 domain-containing protein n=1 Tax=Cephalotus follicularis TaxID=3775 RepID=A0A1Q3ATH6_CEPFO|nr:GUN4 domain-containing protein [Cephalotus follicularis]
MATKSLQSLHHHHHSLLSTTTTTTPPSTLSSSLFLKPTFTATTTSLSITTPNTTTTTKSTTFFSLTPTTSSTPSTSQTSSYDTLQLHLSTQNYRLADEETRRLIIVLAGEAAQERGYVFFSEVQFISQQDLMAIDQLWRQHSNNRFGYSVQKRIWHKVNKDFSKFFIRIGWMKKLETEVEQYNYRSFPTEFMWELNMDTPEGHLPLTNALRGTRLLDSILSHPAFEFVEDEGNDNQGEDKVNGNDHIGGLMGSKPLIKKVLKTDYSF